MSLTPTDELVTIMLKDEVKKWETELHNNLKIVGTLQEQFEETLAEYENNLWIKKETDYHKAMRLKSASRVIGGGIGGTSKETTTPTKKTCNIRKELKPTNNLSETMSSQEQKMWFSDYDHYRAASDLKTETEEMQMAYLHLCLEPEIRSWAKIDSVKDHEEAIKALKNCVLK